MPTETNGAAVAAEPATGRKKVTLNVPAEMAEEFKRACFGYKVEGRSLNDAGEVMIRWFLGLSDAKRRELIGLPKARAKPAK